ncbi:hypothetical protein F5883DRAFT_697769 [Diaporthe sp. PMI_573]|nr:hypothetical protein F5883DRAFT_697769 [Diaporthaceae sp. PMI_573]
MFDEIPEVYTTSEHIPQNPHLSDPLQPIFSDLASIPMLELEPGVGDPVPPQERDQSFSQTLDQLSTGGTARESSSQLDEIAEKLAKLDEKVNYLISVGERCLKAQEHESTKVQNSIRDVKSAIGNLVRRDGRFDSTNQVDNEEQDRMQKLRRENEDLSRKLKLLDSTSAAKEHLIAKLQEDNRRLYRIASDTRQRVAGIATTISEAFEQYREFTEARSQTMDSSISESHYDEIRIYAEANLANISLGTNPVTNVDIDTDVDGECTDSLSEYSIEF